jgi:hypothetical protein
MLLSLFDCSMIDLVNTAQHRIHGLHIICVAETQGIISTADTTTPALHLTFRLSFLHFVIFIAVFLSFIHEISSTQECPEKIDLPMSGIARRNGEGQSCKYFVCGPGAEAPEWQQIKNVTELCEMPGQASLHICRKLQVCVDPCCFLNHVTTVRTQNSSQNIAREHHLYMLNTVYN